MEEQSEMVSKAAAQVQKSLNERAGIGLKVEEAPIPTDRIDGLVEKVANVSSVDEAASLMDEPIKNMAQSVVADTMQRNVAAHGRAGLVPKIKRRTSGKCCEWCDNLAGDYEYPDVPEDVYRRHQRCRCTVDYYPGNGKRQNVWTKEESVVIKDESEREIHENIMPYYYRNARLNEGKVVFDEGLEISAHDREIKIAEFLHGEFGGNILVLNESSVEGEKRADYLWNNRLWDLKTLSSAKAADSAIRKGLKQIAENPGGLILDYGDNNVSYEDAIKVIDGRMVRGSYKIVDVMIIQHNQVVTIMRYKK